MATSQDIVPGAVFVSLNSIQNLIQEQLTSRKLTDIITNFKRNESKCTYSKLIKFFKSLKKLVEKNGVSDFFIAFGSDNILLVTSNSKYSDFEDNNIKVPLNFLSPLQDADETTVGLFSKAKNTPPSIKYKESTLIGGKPNFDLRGGVAVKQGWGTTQRGFGAWSAKASAESSVSGHSFV